MASPFDNARRAADAAILGVFGEDTGLEVILPRAEAKALLAKIERLASLTTGEPQSLAHEAAAELRKWGHL